MIMGLQSGCLEPYLNKNKRWTFQHIEDRVNMLDIFDRFIHFLNRS